MIPDTLLSDDQFEDLTPEEIEDITPVALGEDELMQLQYTVDDPTQFAHPYPWLREAAEDDKLYVHRIDSGGSNVGGTPTHVTDCRLLYNQSLKYIKRSYGRDERVPSVGPVDCPKCLLVVAERRIQNAIEQAVRFGDVESAEHRAWLINQMVHTLAGEKYEQVISEKESARGGPDSYVWDKGVAPNPIAK